MSHLKILVCSLLLAVTLSATSANADHRWPGSQNSGCVRSNGYPAMSGGYRQLVQPYGYSGSRNYGVRAPQMNYGFGSDGYNRPSEYNNQYLPNRSYDRGLRPQYRGYGYDSSDRSSDMVYDSVHGDYHPSWRANSRQPLDFYRSGSEYSYDGRGFHENSGW